MGDLERVNTPDGRFYKTPSGSLYPSVTTVLSHYQSSHIEEWKKRVGEGEAKRVSARASLRGSEIHSLCERYLLGQNPTPGLFDLELFNSFKPLLNRIDRIEFLEKQLYSDFLEVAGTPDCLGHFDGKLSLIDFKTSMVLKEKKDIHSYFMQESAYAVMVEERMNIPVSRIVTLIAVDDHPPQVFIEKRDDWIHQFISLRKEYKECKGF